MKIFETSPRVEPSGSSYRALLAEGFARGASYGLVLRDDGASPESTRLMEALRDFGAKVHRTATWPGTLLLEGEASVVGGPVSAGVLHLLLERAATLYAWRAPALLEDPFVLREDGSVWLATLSRDRSCFVRGPLDEVRHLAANFDELGWSDPVEAKGAAS